jgi:8-oxo-dGTP diphosphatase
MPYQYEFPRPALSTDVVVIDRRHQKPRILLIERLKEPFANHWALPGGFMEIDETLEQAAARELQEETGLLIDDMQQIGAFSTVDRDPRGRIITVAFACELKGNQQAMAADDAKSVSWFELDSLPTLAFDHDEIIEVALRAVG